MKDFELEQMELEFEELKEQIENRRNELIFDKTGLQSNEIYISDFWDCKKSPIGWCVYDNIEDIYHDCCVFCGKPEERK